MADTLTVRDEYRVRNWAILIQKCSRSGLSNREFCRQRGIAENTYYYWLRKLRSQMTEAVAPKLVQLKPDFQAEDFLQIRYRGAELKLEENAVRPFVLVLDPARNNNCICEKIC